MKNLYLHRDLHPLPPPSLARSHFSPSPLPLPPFSMTTYSPKRPLITSKTCKIPRCFKVRWALISLSTRRSAVRLEIFSLLMTFNAYSFLRPSAPPCFPSFPPRVQANTLANCPSPKRRPTRYGPTWASVSTSRAGVGGEGCRCCRCSSYPRYCWCSSGFTCMGGMDGKEEVVEGRNPQSTSAMLALASSYFSRRRTKSL